MEKQTMRHRSVRFELYQNDGFWGWIIGNEMLVAAFAYRDSALRNAQKHIDQLKSK